MSLTPTVFLLAAERLDEKFINLCCGCCWAIYEARREIGGEEEVAYVLFLDRVLQPTNPGTWWYWDPVEGAPDTEQSIRTARILGLILLSILAEEGFEP